MESDGSRRRIIPRGTPGPVEGRSRAGLVYRRAILRQGRAEAGFGDLLNPAE